MIRKLILQNWMSHKDTQIEFREGKILIHGKNGSGKTSIVEGIVFGIFGEVKTSYRGINKQNRKSFIRDGEKSAKIEIEFSVNGKDIKIVRVLYRDKPVRSALYYNSNLVSENDQEILEYIVRLLNVDERLFGNVFYGGQDNIYQLINMPPKELKTSIDRVLGIEEMQDRIDKIGRIINKIRDEIRQTEINLDIYRSKQKELERLKNNYQTVQSKIAELNSYLKSLLENYEKMSKEKDEIEQKYNKYSKYREELIAMKTKIDRLDAEIQRSEKTLKNVDLKSQEELERKKHEIEKELEQFRLNTEESIRLNSIQTQLDERYNDIFKQRNSLYQKIQDGTMKISELEMKRQELIGQRPKNDRSLALGVASAISIVLGMLVFTGFLLITVPLLALSVYEYLRYTKNLKNWQDQIDRMDSEISRMKTENEKTQSQLAPIDQELNSIMEERNRVSEQIREVMSRIPENYGKELQVQREQILKRIADIESYKREQHRLLELKQEIDRYIKELESLNQKIHSLGIDERIYRDWSKRYIELQETIKRTKSEINLLIGQSKEFEKSIAILERDIDEMNRKIERVEMLRILQKELDEIRNKMIELQTKNRQVYIQNINLGMDLFWNSLYSGVVYNSPRITVDKSDGYELKISIGDNEVLADRLSGGEKTIYALSLRLAILNLITRKLRVMILDEPTHNLDDTAIDNLVDNINRLSLDHIDQFIIITHDDRLKNNIVWNQVIQVFRERTKDGSINYSKVLV